MTQWTTSAAICQWQKLYRSTDTTVSTTEAFLPTDPECGTLYRKNSDRTQVSDSLGAHWNHTCLSRLLNHGALWQIVFLRLIKFLLTYLLTIPHKRHCVKPSSWCDLVRAATVFTQACTLLHVWWLWSQSSHPKFQIPVACLSSSGVGLLRYLLKYFTCVLHNVILIRHVAMEIGHWRHRSDFVISDRIKAKFAEMLGEVSAGLRVCVFLALGMVHMRDRVPYSVDSLPK